MEQTSPAHRAPAPPAVAHPPRRAVRIWRVAYYAIGLSLLGLAIWSVSGKSGELLGADAYLGRLRWGWVILAAAAEVASFVSFAGLQRRLLRAGGVRAPLLSITGLTAAGTAIQNTIPGGVVLTTAYVFRRYRRFGADDILAGWVIVSMAVVSFASLALVAAVGVVLALGSASSLDLVAVIAGVVVFAFALVVAWVKREIWFPRFAIPLRVSQKLVRRPRGDPHQLVRSWLDHLGAVGPSRLDWALSLALASGNWLLDMSCLALAFFAVGADVPWHGLLLAYGAGQLASLLPITPGGLGVVEGSLTVALVAFGGVEASSVAAVLVYRVLSFWLVLPVGWGAWTGFNLSSRRADRRAERPQTKRSPLVMAGEEP